MVWNGELGVEKFRHGMGIRDAGWGRNGREIDGAEIGVFR